MACDVRATSQRLSDTFNNFQWISSGKKPKEPAFFTSISNHFHICSIYLFLLNLFFPMFFPAIFCNSPRARDTQGPTSRDQGIQGTSWCGSCRTRFGHRQRWWRCILGSIALLSRGGPNQAAYAAYAGFILCFFRVKHVKQLTVVKNPRKFESDRNRSEK